MPVSNPPYQTIVRPYGKAAIDEAAALIRSGYPVAIPTETVYGLAADATDGEAVARIYAAKGRPGFNPLIVHVLDLAAAEKLGIFNDEARKLAEEYWPGPLTLVVPRRADCAVATLATAGLDTIAIRVPTHRAIRALLEATNLPLAGPSANASGQLSPTRASHVMNSLDTKIRMVIDDGLNELGIESTIIAADDRGVRLLRLGPIVPGLVLTNSDTIEAPGQTISHYAPSKSLRTDITVSRADEWLIGFGSIAGDANLSASGDLNEAAARLFDLLHDADLSDYGSIAVAPIPEHGVGAAINDRLRRASADSAYQP